MTPGLAVIQVTPTELVPVSLGAPRGEDPDDEIGDARILLARAEADLVNACKGGDVGHYLTRSALAGVRGALRLLK